MNKQYRKILCLACLCMGMACSPRINNAQQAATAFPGAEGAGKYASGGRGGQVIIVTSLADAGPGTLREAIRKKGPRIVVFALSGTIKLESDLDINNGDLTIAGQTAPGDGICLRDYPTHVKADNVVIRYLRFRLGDESRKEDDAFNGTGHRNIMIDHCSMSWSVDECASFYYNSAFTMQWCLISESLNESVHSKGAHGYGGIWGGEGATFHHNLIASHKSRNPRFGGSTTTPNPEGELVDFRNNVIFNWGANSIYGGEKGKYNVVGNYFRAGPATGSKVHNRIVNPSSPYGMFYVQGNYVDGDPAVSENNWKGGVQCEHPDSARASKPFPATPMPEETAEIAFRRVLDEAGASLHRDQVDERIVSEARTGNATAGKGKNGLIDSQSEVGGWPVLSSLPAAADTDGDGMPDAWEKSQGLDANDRSDAVKIIGNTHYTAIEIYINELVKMKK